MKSKPLLEIYKVFIDNELSIKWFLRRLMHSSEDIDDIAQETFLRAYKSAEKKTDQIA